MGRGGISYLCCPGHRGGIFYYSKRYAHSAWPAKWQGFIVLLCAWFKLFSC